MHEDERLMIGGLESLQFSTIRNIPYCDNYEQFIKVINILQIVFLGAALLGIEPISDDVMCLKAMVGEEIEGTNERIPHYISILFHHFLVKQTEFVFHPRLCGLDFIKYEADYELNVYGYAKFKGIFMQKGSINFILFVKLLPNLRVFTVGNLVPGSCNPSIVLSPEFCDSILESIDYLNSLTLFTFSKFQIIKPVSSINEFVITNQNKFKDKGWRIQKDVFVGSGW